MFGTYWNDASMLRAALRDSGVSEEAAEIAAAEIPDQTNAWWTITNGRILSVLCAALALVIATGCLSLLRVTETSARDAAVVLAGPIYLIADLGDGQAGLEVSLVLYGLFAVSVAGIFSRLLAWWWPAYRYALFCFIALGRAAGRGMGFLGRALKHAAPANGESYISRAISYHLRWFVFGSLFAFGALTILSVFGQGFYGAFGSDRMVRISAGQTGSVEVFQYSDVSSVAHECKRQTGFRGMPASPAFHFSIRSPGKAPMIVGRQMTNDETIEGVVWLLERIRSARAAEGRDLTIETLGTPDCFVDLRDSLSIESKPAFDALMSL